MTPRGGEIFTGKKGGERRGLSCVKIGVQTSGFTAGKSIVKIPFETEIPENRVGKVYYVDADGNKTDMNATFVNGMVIFETTHFSKYVIVLEETIVTPATSEGSSTLTVLLIVLSVLVVAGAGVCVYFFVIKKKKSTPKTTDSTTTEQ